MRSLSIPITDTPSPVAQRAFGSDAGVTMIETAMILGILLTTVVFIIEYSQSMFTRSMLEEAAYRVGKLASVVPNLELDYRNMNSQDLKSAARFRRAVHSRRIAIEDGEDLLMRVFESSIENDRIPFLNYLTQIFTTRDGLTQTIVTPIAVLLPGECATRADGGSVCNARPYGGSDTGTAPDGTTSELPTAPLDLLTSEFPVRIVMDARLESMVGIMPSQDFQVQNYIYREPIPEGPFSQDIENAIGNGAVAQAGPPTEVPVFGSPVQDVNPPRNWNLCTSPMTNLPMTEMELGERLIRCSMANNMRPCFFPQGSCRAEPR